MSQYTIAQPQNPATGELWFDVNLGIMKVWSGAGWLAITNGKPTETDWAWHRAGLVLRATSHHHENFTETYMKEIQDWCTETSCGTRTSFDTWIFENQADIIAFLLRWS
jgi:hypothetical protein